MNKYRVSTLKDIVTDYIIEAESPEDAMEAWDAGEYVVEHRIEGEEDVLDILKLSKIKRGDA